MIEHTVTNQISWDGSALCFDMLIDGSYVRCRVPRDTVHEIRFYRDALEREIVIDRFRIVNKLAPFLRAKQVMMRTGDVLELRPDEVRA
jgi:hypothetical protein